MEWMECAISKLANLFSVYQIQFSVRDAQNFGSSPVLEPVTLTSDVKQRKQRSQP